MFEAWIFYIHKLWNIVVICKYKNSIFTAFEIILFYLKNLENCEKLIVLCFISGFY